jgi:diketogulonate reductase-like aldo/keto reductase
MEQTTSTIDQRYSSTNGLAESDKITRRDVIKTLGLTVPATLFFGSGKALADSPGAMITPTITPAADVHQRTIPRTNERLPVVGLGTFMTFDHAPSQDREANREVVQRFWEAGGRVIDTSPLYGSSEVAVGQFASELRITDQLFFTNKIWSTGEFLADDSHAERSLQNSRVRLWRDKIDVMQCHSLVNVEVIVPHLRAWKKEHRIRYVGVTHHHPDYFGALRTWIESGEIDFVQVHYSIHTRLAEETVLPAAREHGVAVMVNMPFEKARLFELVRGRDLPDFARELGITSWAQYFLTWIISHPAVTCVLPATSDPAHIVENVTALKGVIPEPAMRDRMYQHVQDLPGFKKLAKMPWYPGKTFTGLVAQAESRIRSRAS